MRKWIGRTGEAKIVVSWWGQGNLRGCFCDQQYRFRGVPPAFRTFRLDMRKRPKSRWREVGKCNPRWERHRIVALASRSAPARSTLLLTRQTAQAITPSINRPVPNSFTLEWNKPEACYAWLSAVTLERSSPAGLFIAAFDTVFSGGMRSTKPGN